MIGTGGRLISAALMGDPTLRLQSVKPPTNLSLEESPSDAVSLTWSAPEDSVLGYHIYRSEHLHNTFARVNPGLIEDTTYIDSAPIADGGVYMVRAVKLESTGSGTYLNLSPGTIDSIGIAADVDPVLHGDFLRNAPNPFRAGTTITFRLAKPSPVVLRIYDVTGRLVRSVDAGRCTSGRHTLEWDGNDADGRKVAGGVYFLSLDTDWATLSSKMVRVE